MKIRALAQGDQTRWNTFVSVGVQLVTKHQWKDYRRHKRRFIRFLDRLLKEHGDEPRVLATRGEMMERDSAKLPYLTRAYHGAVVKRDGQEMVLSAHSIAEIHLARGRYDLATPWVKRLRRNLMKHGDRLWAKDCSEMEKQLKEMRTRVPTVRV